MYAAVLVGLRVGGRRELGQLAPFDLVLILLVANAVQNAMVGSDTTLASGLVVARVRLRSPRLRNLVEGVPIVLIQHGEWEHENLRREALTEDEVRAAVREHGAVGGVEHVALAVLKTDGSVSVVPMSATVHRTPRRLRQLRR